MVNRNTASMGRFLAVVAFLFAIAAMGHDAVAGAPAWGVPSALGVLEPRTKIAFSSELAMPVKRIHFRAGDSFAEGDILVEFDSAVAEANVAAARATHDAAGEMVESLGALAQAQQASRMELEAAERDLALARARLVAAERELAACVIRAPFAGRVAERRINDYEWAGRGAQLLTVVDDAVLQARFLLPESAFGRIAAGDRIVVEAKSLGVTRDGRVARFGAVIDPASGTFDVWADVDNADGALRAGMVVEVRRIIPPPSDSDGIRFPALPEPEEIRSLRPGASE